MKKTFSRTRLIALGYLTITIIGTLLLMLPAASRNGESAGFITSLFTAVSASCVTGLVVVDTVTSWTAFGQVIIITLIQIGGLGFMTIATMFSMLLKRRIGLSEREIMVESINTDHIGGITLLTRKIVLGTLLLEGIGAVLLATRFIPRFGIKRGLWYSVFHSISAFCNAGFDLMGLDEPYSSLSAFSNDIVVNLTICSLIIIGGIGFLVWDDIGRKKKRYKFYLLHTKIVLFVTAVLIIVPTLMFLLFERNYTNEGLSFGHSLLNSFFDAITPRTAGFNTTDTAALSPASKVLTILLMFVGGSPGSTAGGIKTTTIAVIAISTFNGIRRRQAKGIFGRRLEKDAIHKASSVAFTNMSLVVFGVIFVCAVQPVLPIDDVIFECVSAIGTVGMSTGITRSLEVVPRLIIAFLMFCGRVGSVSFALALLERRASPPIKNPRERITIG